MGMSLETLRMALTNEATADSRLQDGRPKVDQQFTG